MMIAQKLCKFGGGRCARTVLVPIETIEAFARMRVEEFETPGGRRRRTIRRPSAPRGDYPASRANESSPVHRGSPTAGGVCAQLLGQRRDKRDGNRCPGEADKRGAAANRHLGHWVAGCQSSTRRSSAPTRGRTASKSTSSSDHYTNGLHQYLQIKPDRPLLHIVPVKFDPPRIIEIAAAVHLPQAGDSRATCAICRKTRSIALDFSLDDRSRTDQAHGPHHHI